MKMTERLRTLLHKRRALFVPGCCNAISARILDLVGFPAIYKSAYGTSLSPPMRCAANFLSDPAVC
jgi:2-methylisocitrate lyase-like PEP mutase family enzyme